MSDHATETSTLLNEAVSSLDASGDASVEAPLPMAVCGTDIMQAGRSSACACIPRLSKRRCASIGTSCVVLLLMLAVGVRLWSQAVGDERFARRWCYSHYKACMAKAGSEAGKTEHEITSVQLPWEGMPDLLSEHSGTHVGEECKVYWVKKGTPPVTRPFYCQCSSDLAACTVGYSHSEEFGESGINFQKMRNTMKVANILFAYAIAIVLPLAVAVQCCHDFLFGSDESPSVFWRVRQHMALHSGAYVQPTRKWLHRYWRFFAAVSVGMVLPLTLVPPAIILGCPHQHSWTYCPSRVLVSIAILMLVPCLVVSCWLFEVCAPLPQLHAGQWVQLKAITDSCRPSVTVEEGGSAGGVWVVRVSGAPLLELKQHAPNPLDPKQRTSDPPATAGDDGATVTQLATQDSDSQAANESSAAVAEGHGD